MLNGKIVNIKAGDKSYPLFCDFNTLEYLQRKYGSIKRYQEKIIGAADQDAEEKIEETDIGAILDGLQVMMKEGLDVLEIPDTQITAADVGLILRMANMSLTDARVLVLSQLSECILPKKKETPTNPETEKRHRLTLHGFFISESIFSAFRRKKSGG